MPPPLQDFTDGSAYFAGRVQGSTWVLEDQAHIGTDVLDLIWSEAFDSLVGNLNGALVKAVQTQNGARQCGLATTAPPNDAQSAAARQTQAHVSQGRRCVASVCFPCSLDFEQHGLVGVGQGDFARFCSV